MIQLQYIATKTRKLTWLEISAWLILAVSLLLAKMWSMSVVCLIAPLLLYGIARISTRPVLFLRQDRLEFVVGKVKLVTPYSNIKSVKVGKEAFRKKLFISTGNGQRIVNDKEYSCQEIDIDDLFDQSLDMIAESIKAKIV